LVTGAKRGLAYAMVAPYESRVARGTKAYVAYRMPRLAHVLLAGDRSHPEWECAVLELEELVRWISQTPAQAAAAMTAMADASDTVAPAPSAAEVMTHDAVEIANVMVPASKIDDYRPRSAPPRNLVVPEHMRVLSLRDLWLG
jgi:hypothetical protein